MKLKLYNGYTLIDKEDLPKVSAYSWHLSPKGYVVRTKYTNGKWIKISMHRVIMNAPKGVQTDHINHDRSDNRKKNLRLCDNSQNQQNRSIGRNNKSGFKGVSWNREKGKWVAVIHVNGLYTHLGYFSLKKDAANAYSLAAKKYFKEYAYTT